MKKTLALLLAVLLAVGTFAGCGNNDTQSTPNTDNSSNTENTGNFGEDALPVPGADASDEEIYNYILGEFNEYYQKAMNASSVSERFALEAIAEAKLLESGAFLPVTCNGGNYAISRVIPYSMSSAMWGNDSYRYHNVMVATEPLKAADRAEIKALWNESENAAAFTESAKKLLKDKGYTLKDSYNMAYSSDPQTWDVLATYMQVDSEPVIQTYDGLLEYDRKNELQPALAESYTVSDDGLVYTFKIREGVKWVDSQGREVGEVTADDWVAGMQHMMDSMGGLEYLVDGLIVNATEYMYGDITDMAQVGVKALDKYTLEYTLTGETSYFLTMLGYGVFAPLNRAYYESQGGVFGADAYAAAKDAGSIKYGTGPNTIAYCGPFLVTNFTAGNAINFKANPNYWDKDNMSIKELNWLYNDGSEVTKTYTDMKAATIDGAGLNSSTMELAKVDGLFEDYAYTSSTDASCFPAFFNVNRKAFANYNDASVGVSAQTDEMKAATHTAMMNRHFRNALTHSFDRAAVSALSVGETLKYNSMVNAYVPGNFVKLEEDVTVAINGADTTFAAGTNYGVIVQAQLDADGSSIKAYDPAMDDGLGSSAGFDGWYNPAEAIKEMDLAIEELKAQGLEISAENPIHLDLAVYEGSETRKNQGQAYKKSIETVLGGKVILDIVGYEKGQDYNNATYMPQEGANMNYDMNTNSGWGPDFGDPKTYLDTMLPNPGGMAKCMGMF